MGRATKKNPVILPVKKQSRATFECILKATTYFIERRGPFNFTTNEIAEKAGVNINSFYQYFFNKEAAIGEVVNRFLKQDEEWFADLVASSHTIEEILQGAQEIMRRNFALRKEILVNIAALVGSERVYLRRRNFAALIEPFMPTSKFKSKDERFLGAQVVVHTFLSVEVGFMDGHSRDENKSAIQREINGLILNYLHSEF